LEDIFEDVETLGRVPQHLVVQEEIGIVSLAHLFRTSSFKKVQSVALVE